MRTLGAEEIAAALFSDELRANLPVGKVTAPTAAELPAALPAET